MVQIYYHEHPSIYQLITYSATPFLTNFPYFRHLGVSLEMLHKLVRTFGPVIHSTLSAGPSVGVDLQAEQRFAFYFSALNFLKI